MSRSIEAEITAAYHWAKNVSTVSLHKSKPVPPIIFDQKNFDVDDPMRPNRKLRSFAEEFLVLHEKYRRPYLKKQKIVAQYQEHQANLDMKKPNLEATINSAKKEQESLEEDGLKLSRELEEVRVQKEKIMEASEILDSEIKAAESYFSYIDKQCYAASKKTFPQMFTSFQLQNEITGRMQSYFSSVSSQRLVYTGSFKFEPAVFFWVKSIVSLIFQQLKWLIYVALFGFVRLLEFHRKHWLFSGLSILMLAILLLFNLDPTWIEESIGTIFYTSIFCAGVLIIASAILDETGPYEYSDLVSLKKKIDLRNLYELKWVKDSVEEIRGFNQRGELEKSLRSDRLWLDAQREANSKLIDRLNKQRDNVYKNLSEKIEVINTSIQKIAELEDEYSEAKALWQRKAPVLQAKFMVAKSDFLSELSELRAKTFD